MSSFACSLLMSCALALACACGSDSDTPTEEFTTTQEPAEAADAGRDPHGPRVEKPPATHHDAGADDAGDAGAE